MHKMLAIAAGLTLVCGMARADALDRSKLSYEENATVNAACTDAAKQGIGAFNACIARQLADLHDHPTPDRSGLTHAQNHTIETACGYLRRQGVAPYNDCLKKAVADLKHERTKAEANGRKRG